MTQANFTDCMVMAHKKAFTVTASIPPDCLRAIQAVLYPLVVSGASWNEANKALSPAVRRIQATLQELEKTDGCPMPD